MKSKLMAVFFAGLSTLTAEQTFASTYNFQVGPPVEYALPPHAPQEIANIFMWQIRASCQIVTEEQMVPIAFRVLRKTGTINNISLAKGDAMTLIFYPNQKVSIVAESGGIVELENQGEKKINAVCSLT